MITNTTYYLNNALVNAEIDINYFASGFASVRMLSLIALHFAPYLCAFLRFLYDFNFSRSAQCFNNNFWGKRRLFVSHCQQLTFRRRENTAADILAETRKKIPFVESTFCMNCHRLLPRIVVLETKLLAGLPKQVEQQIVITGSLSVQPVSPVNLNSFLPSVEEQAKMDRQTNRWQKQ